MSNQDIKIEAMKDDVSSYQSILELIGNTPLIKLNKSVKNYKGNFYSKFEAFNPGHSNKDRIALHIIEAAEKRPLKSKFNHHRNDFW